MTEVGPTADDGPRSVSRLAVQLAVVTAAAVVVLDQATKELAEATLRLGEYVPLFGDAVGWQLVYNNGAAFGLPAPAWLFLIVTVLVTVIVARALPRTTSLMQAGAYGLLLAGALGNAIDRLVRPNRIGEVGGFFQGDVVDFVAWGSFPRFNVADSAITVGFVLLTLAMWSEERTARTGEEHGDDAVADADADSDADSASAGPA